MYNNLTTDQIKFVRPCKVWAIFGLVLTIMGVFPVVKYAYQRIRA